MKKSLGVSYSRYVQKSHYFKDNIRKVAIILKISLFCKNLKRAWRLVVTQAFWFEICMVKKFDKFFQNSFEIIRYFFPRFSHGRVLVSEFQTIDPTKLFNKLFVIPKMFSSKKRKFSIFFHLSLKKVLTWWCKRFQKRFQNRDF